MSLNRSKRKGLGPRLVLSVTLLLFLSLTIVSSTIYFLLAKSLRDNDLEHLRKLGQSYAQTYAAKGVTGLRSEIPPEIYVSISGSDGKVKFTRLPEFIDQDFEDADEIRQLEAGAAKLPLRPGLHTLLLLSGEENNDLYQRFEFRLRQYVQGRDWTGLLPIIDNDLFEVYLLRLPSGEWMKVGMSPEKREEHLASIRMIALIVFTPFIFIGVILSALLSRRILKPIRDLESTIHLIKSGKSGLRGKVSGTGDEIDVLTTELNSLLDKNDHLVENIKTTVDNVAHDLRTPLTRLRSSAEYALTKGTDESRKEALQDALENSTQILDLLNAIMDLAEAETQTMKIQLLPVHLLTVINRLTDFFQFTAEEKNISFAVVVSDSIWVRGDVTRLLQALSNLIDNAIKYSGSGTSIRILSEVSGDIVKLSVIDKGIGIPESDLSRVWDRLYRSDRSRATPGAGIGLSLVKAIVQVHGGNVGVTSIPDQGSTFWLTLPICNAPANSP